MKLSTMVLIGGALYLFKQWQNSPEKTMKRMGLDYGARVRYMKKDAWGNEKMATGKIVKYEGNPYVILDKSMSGANKVPWEPSWQTDTEN
jgi:hypothetical protein